MDAKEFLKCFIRYCNNTSCDDCVMIADGCYPGSITDIDRLIDKVEQWGKNNPLPRKVIRQDRMLEQFPYAPLDKNGVIDQCPDYPTYGFSSAQCKKYNNDCYACRKAYWLEEVDPDGRC